jgi:MYXO-CTERM domain-containing protein
MKLPKLHIAVVSLAAAFTMEAQAVTFSFTTGTWVNPNSATAAGQVGFLQPDLAATTASGTTVSDGVTLTFNATFVGTSTKATGAGSSFINSTADPNGFIFGSSGDTNAGFVSLVNYQRWDFSFSSPIAFDSIFINDVDNTSLAGSTTGGFRDAVAGESFATNAFGAVGSGSQGIYTFFPSATNTPTILYTDTIAAGAESLDYVTLATGAIQGNNLPETKVAIGFGSTPVTAFSLYTFSDRSAVHRLSIAGSTFSSVPEVSSAALGALSLLGFLSRRRRA